MYIKKMILFFSLVVLFTACSEQSDRVVVEQLNWENLVDQDLSQWDTYLSFKHQVGYDGNPPKDSLGNLIEPVGLNKPGYNVFTTIIEKDKPVIKVGGEYYGCIVTKKEYANYHFQLKFKWGNKKLTPRKKLLKDSGILYHSIGEHGAEHWRSWMLSQEFQVMEGHTGDYWKQATSAIDIRAYAPETSMMPALAHESQPFLPIGYNEDIEYYCMRGNNYENKHGEWNTLDLICYEDKALHIVNGEVVMILKNSRYTNENDQTLPLTKGKIQLQSEAAELFYKDIQIRSIDALSEEYAAYF